MAFVLEPLVAGELGDETVLDTSTHPPLVRHLEYVLDAPTDEDLIESFPVFLVSDELAAALVSAELVGFHLADAIVRPGSEYLAVYGALPHKHYRWLQLTSATSPDCWLDEQYRLCVSERMFAVISRHRIDGCDVAPMI